MNKFDPVAAKERCEAATRGPWRRQGYTVVKDTGLVLSAVMSYPTVPIGTNVKANAEFAAHARSDLPAALEALEGAEQRGADALNQAAKQVRGWVARSWWYRVRLEGAEALAKLRGEALEPFSACVIDTEHGLKVVSDLMDKVDPVAYLEARAAIDATPDECGTCGGKRRVLVGGFAAGEGRPPKPGRWRLCPDCSAPDEAREKEKRCT